MSYLHAPILTAMKDGVLDVQIAEVLKQGSGTLLGIDNSPAMVAAAVKTVGPVAPGRLSFEGKMLPPFRHEEI